MASCRPGVFAATGLSAAAALLSILSVLLIALPVRDDDLTAASLANNFTVVDGQHTCVEYISDEQLKRKGYDKIVNCEEQDEIALSEVLAASTHLLFWAGTNDSAKEHDVLGRLMRAVASNSTGEANASVSKEEAANATWRFAVAAAQGEDIGHATVSSAYGAVSRLSALDSTLPGGLPTTCEQIYPSATLIVDPAAYDPSKAVLPEAKCSSYSGAGSLVEANVSKLYTHCVHQFAYGRSGPTPSSFNVPVVGAGAEPAGPLAYPLFAATSKDVEMPWYQRSRSFQGLRYGWSLAAYVSIVATSAFIGFSAALLLVFEILSPPESGSNGASHSPKLLVGFVGVVLSCTVWGVLVGWPWAVGSRLARPLCEKGVGDHNALMSVGWIGTINGWKEDRDATAAEVTALGLQLAALLLLLYPAQADRGKSVLTKNSYTAFAVAVALVLIGVQALFQGHFGLAWADAVSGRSQSASFHASAIGAAISEQTGGTLAISAFSGLLVAAVVESPRASGGIVQWAAWAALAAAAFVVLLVIFGIDHFTAPDEVDVADCKIFDSSEDYPMGSAICTVRAFTLAIGAGVAALIAGAIAVVKLGNCIGGGELKYPPGSLGSTRASAGGTVAMATRIFSATSLPVDIEAREHLLKGVELSAPAGSARPAQRPSRRWQSSALRDFKECKF